MKISISSSYHKKSLYGIIYCVQNTVNNKRYVGQTTSTLGIRKQNHRSKSVNIHIDRAFIKYGFDVFVWDIVDFAESQEELDRLECYWIKKHNTLNRNFGYNCRDGGSRGKLSEETKLRISEAHRGKILSEETKTKMSNYKRSCNAWVGSKNPKFGKGIEVCGESNPMYGKNHSDETKKKISLQRRANPIRRCGAANPMYGKIGSNAQAVMVYKKGELVGEFEAIAYAAKYLNISNSHAAKLVRIQGKTRDGIEIIKK